MVLCHNGRLVGPCTKDRAVDTIFKDGGVESWSVKMVALSSNKTQYYGAFCNRP